MTDKDREAFESHIVNSDDFANYLDMGEEMLARDKNDKYHASDIQTAWEVFQAACAYKRQATIDECYAVVEQLFEGCVTAQGKYAINNACSKIQDLSEKVLGKGV